MGVRSRQPAGLAQGFVQQHFDLPVDTPEFVGRPAFQCIIGLGTDPQGECFLFAFQSLRCSSVDGSGIDDRGGGTFAAQHDQEIADHGGLLLFIQLHDFFF